MQHLLAVDITKRESNGITIKLKESDISFDDLVYLIKYADDNSIHPSSNLFLWNLHHNRNYLSLVDFKNHEIHFDFESKSHKDYWLQKLKTSLL